MTGEPTSFTAFAAGRGMTVRNYIRSVDCRGKYVRYSSISFRTLVRLPAFRRFQALFQGCDFFLQAFGQVVAEFGEVFFDQRDLG